MMPCRDDAVVFVGFQLAQGSDAMSQAEAAAAGLSTGMATQFICYVGRPKGAILVCITWDRLPKSYANLPEALELGRQRRQVTLWATLDGLAGSPAHESAAMVGLRLTAMGGVHFGNHLVIGMSLAALPVIKHRAAGKFQCNAVMPEAGEAWSRFLDNKIQPMTALVQALVKADGGNGTLKALVVKVRSTVDYTAEVPEPDHALPIFESEIPRQILVSQRPAPPGPPAGAGGAEGLPAAAVDGGALRVWAAPDRRQPQRQLGLRNLLLRAQRPAPAQHRPLSPTVQDDE